MNAKTRLTGITGFVFGLLIFAWGAWTLAPKVMILEDVSQYDYARTVAEIQAGAKEQGWKIPKMHQLHQTMAKHGYEVPPVTVFELCHVDHAAKVLSHSDSRVVTSMMPCRVSVYVNDDGQVIVSRMNSGLIAQVFDDNVADVMDTASQETEVILQRVLQQS